MAEKIFTAEIQNPLTLQKFLTEKKGVSKRLLTKLKRIPMGITRNGLPIRSIDIVCNGDIIKLNLSDEKFLEPNPELKVPVIFENEDIAIFEKPAGMPVHPSIKHQGDTLGNCFAYLYPEFTFRPVNRLDCNTSGLCAVAKNSYGASHYQGKIKKTYFAVAEGITEESGTINAPIARERESIILRCVREDGQKAVTHYKRLLFNEKYSLLEVNPETGRTHQIRVHFAYIGHPLAGDDMYGGKTDIINRQALHCGIMEIDRKIIKSQLSSDISDIFEEDFLI